MSALLLRPAYASRSAEQASGIRSAPERAFDCDDGRFEQSRVGAERGQELGDGAAGAGIAQLGRDLVERDEDEGALGEAGMRDFEVQLADEPIAIKKDIEIEGARAVGNGVSTVAAEFALEREEGAEQVAWGEVGFNGDDGVDEAGLIGDADGRGGVQRGAGSDAAERGKAFNRSGERGCRRAGGAGKIGAEGEVGEGQT